MSEWRELYDALPVRSMMDYEKVHEFERFGGYMLWLEEQATAQKARAERLARAALAYDAAIQRHAEKGASWVDGDDLDDLYGKWLTCAWEIVQPGDLGETEAGE